MRLFKFILYSSIFAATCVVGLTMATERLLLENYPPIFHPLHIFVFANTLIVYNIHYYSKKIPTNISDRAAWSQKNKRTHLVVLIIALLISLFSLFYLSMKIAIICAFLGLISFAYSLPLLPYGKKRKLKEYGILKIVLLSLVWTMVSVYLPIIYYEIAFSDYQLEFYMRFVFMFPLCAAFDIRDMHIDEKYNIKTLPNSLGIENTYKLIHVFIVLWVLLSLWQFLRIGALDRLIINLFFTVLMKIAIDYTRKKTSDIFYLFIIDGLMLFYSLFIIFLG
ncbi:MAG TPA: UbiA family prenyltransferase [Chitinophagaceae bacterium]|nr:UbiA family prenyltransferase [Chitinophagaceae bacterium]